MRTTFIKLGKGKEEEWQTSPCNVHDKWVALREHVLEYLTTTTIAELAGVEDKHRKPVK